MTKKRNWTESEENKLIELYHQKTPNHEIAQRLDRTENAIKFRIHHLRKQNRLPHTKKSTDIPPNSKFGHLTVIKRVENSVFNNAQFLCHCDCGNDKVVPGYRLRFHHTTSCGCRSNRYKVGDWTPQQKEFLKQHYPDKRYHLAWIGQQCGGRSERAVRHFARMKLGLSRPKGAYPKVPYFKKK